MVAENIKRFMDENGIKQRTIAQKCGVPEGKISAILTGRTRLTADVFFLICKALGQSPDFFDPEKPEKESA